MKTLALFLLAAGASIALADENLITNGDFSNGISHWEGDVHSADSSVVDLSAAPAASSGVVVKLRSHDWTKVTQDFDGNVGQYQLTITYTPSPDAKFSSDVADYTNASGSSGLTRLPPFNSTPGKWIVVVCDLGAAHYRRWEVNLAPGASASQTFTGHVRLNSDDSEKKGLFLIFPPGEGTITLQSVSLVPSSS